MAEENRMKLYHIHQDGSVVKFRTLYALPGGEP